MDLTSEEHMVLEQAAAAGGRFTVRGLSPAQMKHAADVATVLQGLGLTNIVIHESGRDAEKPVDSVTVELTDKGRAYLSNQ